MQRIDQPELNSTSQTSELLKLLFKWTDGIIKDPSFSAYRKRRLVATLHFDDPISPPYTEGELNYTFSPKTDRQHDLVMMFFNLWEAKESLKQCEYYFRRYPFYGLPVSMDEHIRNVCEMYFNWFYIIRERIKKILNLLNEVTGVKREVGAYIKRFDAEFDAELRARNAVHHSSSFEDLKLERLKVLRIISRTDSQNGVDRGWAAEHGVAYRALTREWAQRVKRRSAVMDVYVDKVAEAMIADGKFLNVPPDLRA